MKSRPDPWNQSRLAFLLAAILFPPLGILLLWKRRGVGRVARIFGSVAMLVLVVVHLVLFFGLRMEFDGTGSRPIFRFGTRESHYRALERDRARQEQLAATVAEPAAPKVEPPAAAEAVSVPAKPAPAAYWTDFRGPSRDGRYEEAKILTEWPDKGLPLEWRQPVGGGYASFVIAQGKAFTIEQRRDREVVAAYDLRTGRELWTNSWNGHFQESMGGDGPRATPTWDEGRLYAQGAEGELRCLDAGSGNTIWSLNMLADNGASNLKWGMAASPLVVGEKLIVLPGGGGGRSVVAYHKLTGKPIWKALDDRQAYTSPMLVTLAGKRQLLVVSAERVMGLTVEEGALLWDYPWVTEYGINSAQPIVVGENRFFISAGYGHGAAMVEVTPAGDRFSARTVWQNIRMKNKFTSSVLHDGHIYGLDESILACIDVETGRQKWKGGRYGYGQLLLAGEHLVVTTEGGDLALVRATPERHDELARFSAVDGKTWNHPAMAGGLLLVRNTTEMACFRIAPR